MSPMRRRLVLAAVHVAIVASLGAKLMVDRVTRPRVWARTAPVDPNLPIRGRYVNLRVEASAPGFSVLTDHTPVSLTVRDGVLVAEPSSGASDVDARVIQRPNGERIALVTEPLAYFIPEHAADPSRRSSGEELWVEVTIPRRGPPRPIRLGVKKEGVLTPLDLK